jgi:hypothetical protein
MLLQHTALAFVPIITLRHKTINAARPPRAHLNITPMPDDPESLTLRATVIGGIRCADDYQVIWRGPTIGRIMRIDSRASDANIAAMAGPGGCTPEASAGASERSGASLFGRKASLFRA